MIAVDRPKRLGPYFVVVPPTIAMGALGSWLGGSVAAIIGASVGTNPDVREHTSTRFEHFADELARAYQTIHEAASFFCVF